MDFGDDENAFGECAGFIECDYADVGEGFEIVAAFYQNTVAGRATYAGEDAERDTHDEGAGARNGDKADGAVNPFGERAKAGEGRHKGDGKGDEHDCGGEYAGELCDELFAFGLFRLGVLHKVEDFGYGAFAIGFCDADFKGGLGVYRAGKHIIADVCRAGDGFAGDGLCIKERVSGGYDAVEGDFFAGADYDYIADCDVGGGKAEDLTVALYICKVGANVHKFGYVAFRAFYGEVLE